MLSPYDAGFSEKMQALENYSQRLSLFIRSALENAVHQAVRNRLIFIHEIIALRIRGDLCDVLSRVMGKDLIQPFSQPQDLTGMDIDIGRLPLEAAPGLVNHDPGMR